MHDFVGGLLIAIFIIILICICVDCYKQCKIEKQQIKDINVGDVYFWWSCYYEEDIFLVKVKRKTPSKVYYTFSDGSSGSMSLHYFVDQYRPWLEIEKIQNSYALEIAMRKYSKIQNITMPVKYKMVKVDEILYDQLVCDGKIIRNELIQ